MSVVLQVHSASFGGVYNIPKASSGSPIPPENLLILGTPTNTKITFAATNNGANIEGELYGNFQYPLVMPKNYSQFLNTVNGTISGVKIYLNNVLMQTSDYSPSVGIIDEELALTDKTAAAKLYSGNDTFIGPTNITKLDDSDTIDGFGGNDIFYGNGSGKYDDIFYGGTGIDTSIFRSNLINYTITPSTAIWNNYTEKAELKGYNIKAKTGNDGQQQVSGVERLKFSDTSLALDIDGNAGIALKVLGAVFGKYSVNNKQYVGIGLDLLDKGMSYETLGGLALSTANLKTNDQIVTALWANVVGSFPSENDKAPFIGMLQDGLTAGALVRMAADTSFNTANINLVGLAKTGIEYTPVG